MVRPSIAIIGAGIGGLTAAASLLRAGFKVDVYEQARGFTRVGAGIQMSPNAMKVLRSIGLEEQLLSIAFEPPINRSREFDSGAITNEYPLKGVAEDRYGAPYLLLHRGDLHLALAATVPAEVIHLRKELVEFDQDSKVRMRFADGSSATADIMIGADGVHSRVREILFGPDDARYTGRVAYRTTFKAALLGDLDLDWNTKWWGPDRHIVIYYITRSRDEIYFVTSVPEARWEKESWSQTGSLDDLRAAFASFHPQVRAVLEACPEVHKWGIFERDPMPRWTSGRVTLLGDSCHPMTPYMAQGAATSMEDAAVLARCLSTAPDFPSAFQLYEDTRRPRTADIQLKSRTNTWMRKSTDADWVFGYDALSVPLGDPGGYALSQGSRSAAG